MDFEEQIKCGLRGGLGAGAVAGALGVGAEVVKSVAAGMGAAPEVEFSDDDRRRARNRIRRLVEDDNSAVALKAAVYVNEGGSQRRQAGLSFEQINNLLLLAAQRKDEYEKEVKGPVIDV